ncbi:MAG TPA: FtsQ-type POTRA domain-containing protein [Rectinemataceae bacterium]|nr:FtsQ-type POTRA domain-containing protein [Rectinemataceae bacterium]
MSESALHDRLRTERQDGSSPRRPRDGGGFPYEGSYGSGRPGAGFRDWRNESGYGESGRGESRGFAQAPRGRNAHRPVARDPAVRGIVLLLLVAAVVALVAAAALLLPSALRITHYEVAGTATMSRSEVLSAALIHDKEYFFTTDPRRVRANLLADPRIADAQVRRIFPDGLRIVVRERQAVATALAELDGEERLVLIDGTGMAFAAADPSAVPASVDNLPLVSGLRFEGFRPGTRLPDELTPFFSSLGEIERGDGALLSAFSEIRLVKPRFGETELVLYPVQYRIPVRAAAVLNASTLRSIILVLDVLGSRNLGASVAEIDFRTGTVVYRSKEGQSG